MHLYVIRLVLLFWPDKSIHNSLLVITITIAIFIPLIFALAFITTIFITTFFALAFLDNSGISLTVFDNNGLALLFLDNSVLILVVTTTTVTAARANTSTAVQVTALEATFSVDSIQLEFSFVLEEHVVNQVQAGKDVGLLLGSQTGILIQFQSKDISIGSQFRGKLTNTIRPGLDNLSNKVSLLVCNFKGVVEEESTNTANGVRLNDGIRFLIFLTIHNF
mmetsp:Transcript_46207/g.111996  ORF Transcript_46207/g.111996 Transcript_46207/m.111996 type:complete len:221 (+) Transcript_46207:1747-2409(+)